MLTRKTVFCTALLIIGVLLLAGCAAPTPTPAPTAPPPPPPTSAPVATAAPAATKAPAAATATTAPQPTSVPPTAVPTKAAVVNYPTRPVKVYLTHGPGSGIDIVGRLMAPYLQKYLGQSVVLENLEGGGGRTARAQVFKEKPDGYTLIVSGFPSMQLGELVYDGQYKTAEWTYIYNFQGGGDYGIIYVAKDGPYKTLKDLIDASKTKQLKIANPGMGSSAHAFAVLLREKAGLNSVTLQFPAAQEIMAVAAGDVPAAVDTVSGAVGSDKITPLAVASDHDRSKMLPNIPTTKELGYPGLEVPYRVGLVGPPGMPADVTKVLVDAMAKAVADPQMKADFEKAGLFIEAQPPDEFKQMNLDLLKSMQDIVPAMKKDMAQ